MSNTISNTLPPVTMLSAKREDVPKNKEEKEIKGTLTEEQIKVLDKIVNENKYDSLKLSQDMGKDQFMHILLKQMTNQNPLQPVEDKDFIAQMAQFSSLENIQQLNKNFKGLGETVESIKALLSEKKSNNSELEATIKSMAENIAEINKTIKEQKAAKAYDK